MDRFFNAKSLAVIGVSPRHGNLGRNIVTNLTNMGYKGEVYLVSPKGGEYQGRKIYQNPGDLPDAPELAVILTPAATVPGLVQACADRGIKRLIIESGGFSELSADRAELEKQIADIARQNNIRFIGPNCIGVISTHSGLSVPFPVLTTIPKKGGISILSQSGGTGLTYLFGCSQEGMGVAKFVSMGNKLNVGEADLFEYMSQDPETDVILLYLESIVEGRRLFELMKKSPKPVIVHKSNIAPTSNAIAQSHTAALTNDDTLVDAVLEQAGALRGRTVSQTINLAKGLCLPKAKGKKVAVISRSGGHAVVAADALHRNQMELAELPDSYFEEIQKSTRASVIKLQNPLDLGDLFEFELYKKIVEEALKNDQVDCALVLHGYRGPEVEASRQFVSTVGELCRCYKKPVALSLQVDQREIEAAAKLCGLPLFPAPDEAMEALAASLRAGQRYPDSASQPDQAQDLEQAAVILKEHGQNGELELPEALAFIKAAGIHCAAHETVTGKEEALLAADLLGYPLVLKAVGISHKTEQKAVSLGLADREELAAAYDDLWSRLSPRRMLIMKQVEGSVEIIAGGKRDQAFGAVMLCGLGGITAEALRDVSLRLAPVGGEEAASMLDGLKGAALLKEYRGAPPCSRRAMVDALLRLSSLLDSFPAIREIDLNPLMAGPEDCLAVDARVFVDADQI